MEIGKSKFLEYNLDMFVFYYMDYLVLFEEGNIFVQICMFFVNEIKDCF